MTKSVPANSSSRLRMAELTSGLGALVLGIGVGALLGDRLARWAVPILVAGAAVHGWGMLDKHRLTTDPEAATAWWERALYWGCWILLALLGLAVAAQLVSGT